MSALLTVNGLSVRFGGVQALADVDLEVEDGQLVGLIGPNGAGKTTFIDAATGFVPHRGRVVLDGRDLRKLRPHARAERGLARTWQSLELFNDLTVGENLAVAAHRPTVWTTVKECLGGAVSTSSITDEVLTMLGLEEHAEAMPHELSQGHRKLVGVARAMVAQPHLLCLDEPAAGLDSTESEELGKRLRQVADEGTAMLLVDHDMDLVLSICETLVVLDFGKVIARGTPDEVRRDPAVVAAYLGGSELQPPATEARPGEERGGQ